MPIGALSLKIHAPSRRNTARPPGRGLDASKSILEALSDAAFQLVDLGRRIVKTKGGLTGHPTHALDRFVWQLDRLAHGLGQSIR